VAANEGSSTELDAPNPFVQLLRWMNRYRRSRVGRKLIARLGYRLVRPGTIAQDVTVGNGFRMTLRLDAYLDRAIYFDAFEHTTCEVLSSLLRPNDTFIDVGANIGFFSLMAARLVGVGGRVVAFEPNRTACARLRLACQLNGCDDIVVVREYGLANRQGTVPLFVPNEGDEGLASLRHPGNGIGYSEHRIGLRRLDDEWSIGTPLRVLKVDVEGSELEVLRGAQGLLTRERPHVVCEFNEETARRFGYHPVEIVRFLLDGIGGYQLNLLTSREIVHDVAPGSWREHLPKLENLWFAPRRARL